MKKSEDQIFRERQAKEGRKGGQATLKNHGRQHFVDAANKRWNKDGQTD